MHIDQQGLTQCLQELSTLTRKPSWSKNDERRNAYLLSAISAIKTGASLKSIELDRVNDAARSMGINPTALSSLTEEQEVEARGWSAFLKHSPKAGNGPVELRDMTEGSAAAISRIGTYTSFGRFVPTGFVDNLFASMAAHDALYDPESVTVLRTPTGAPIAVPLASDVENVATLITSEPAASTSTDIGQLSHQTLGAYSFSSPRYTISMEAEQDLVGSLTVKQLANRFFADRLSRGIGSYLVKGTGSDQPTGILQALQNVGAPIVIAAGSSGNTGGAETGSTSLGTADFANAFAELDPAYLASPKIAWMMNMTTLGKLMAMVDKMGFPPINFVNGARQILGIPIKICPSMDPPGPSRTPVILGDWSYWCTRLIFDETSGIQVLREAPGLAENGNMALKLFARADSNILYTYNGSASAKCPFVSLMNAS